MKLDMAFGHSYQVGVNREFSGVGVFRQFEIPPGGMLGRYPLAVEVRPAIAAPWVGLFACGTHCAGAFTGVVSAPNPDIFFAVADGQGYRVCAEDPEQWEDLAVMPVLTVVSMVPAGLVVFGDLCRFAAYGKGGHAWTTADLAWDGMRIDAADERGIWGAGEDPASGEEKPFFVDLRTGCHTGGI